MYFPIFFLAIFLALACPSSHHSGTRPSGSGTVTAQDSTLTGVGGSGGDQGHEPPH